MADDKMEIGTFDVNEPLQLRRLPNGGWVVSQRAKDPARTGLELGAYSTAKEMLTVLAKHLK